jgi:hypothetical protein
MFLFFFVERSKSSPRSIRTRTLLIIIIITRELSLPNAFHLKIELKIKCYFNIIIH